LAEFYLGHRKSFDLDLFTSEKELILPFSRILEEEMKKSKKEDIDVDAARGQMIHGAVFSKKAPLVTEGKKG